MEKVYQNGNIWSVNDLTDLYSFKCVNILTNEETNAILSWTFKDSLGGTKVTIHSKGKMDILTKITIFFKIW